jgi:hypothetical protein
MSVSNNPNAKLWFSLVSLIAAGALLQCTLFALPSDFDPTYVPSWVAPSALDSVPGWITGRGEGNVEFRRVFFVHNPATWASLTIAAHDDFEILVNGKAVADRTSAPGVAEYDVGKNIVTGENLLQIRVKTERGRPALVACLQVAGQAPLVTDSNWQQRSATRTAAAWQAAIAATSADQLPSAAQITGWPALPAMTRSRDPFWIWSAQAGDNQRIYFRRNFKLNAVPKSAVLWITADDAFDAWLNGQKILSGHNWSDPQHRNVESLLKTGDNCLAICGINMAGDAGLLSELFINGVHYFGSDEDFRMFTSGPPADGWAQPGFDDTAWMPAFLHADMGSGEWVKGLKNWPGFSRTRQPYFLCESNRPAHAVAEAHPGDGKIVSAENLTQGGVIEITPPPADSKDLPSILLDFGHEINGRVKIEALTAATVKIGTGETMEEATGKPWSKSDLVLAAGESGQTAVNTGFRYALLTFPPASDSGPERIKVSAQLVYYPVVYRGAFDCSDPELTRMWYVGAYTAHLNMQNDIWDGIKRDRGLWSGDYAVSGDTIGVAFGDEFLTKKSFAYLLRGRLDKHHINGISGYSAAWVVAVANYHRRHGDYEFIKSIASPLKTMLEHMKEDLDTQYLFQNLTYAKQPDAFMFCDWSPGIGPRDDNAESRAITDLYYLEAFRSAAWLFREMGDGGSATAYDDLADKMTVSARKYLFDPKTASYTLRIQANARAVLAGVATSDQWPAMYENAFEPVIQGWNGKGSCPPNLRKVTPYYLGFILPALSQMGQSSSALELARLDWGGMLKIGATSFWENFDIEWSKSSLDVLFKKLPGLFNLSLCHAWSSGVSSWLTEYILGIRPTSAGYNTIQIVPDLMDLNWVSGDVPTPRGAIRLQVSRTEKKMSLSLQLPPHTIATIGLPPGILTVDGKCVNPTRREGSHVFFDLSSAGEHSLQSEW